MTDTGDANRGIIFYIHDLVARNGLRQRWIGKCWAQQW